MQLRWSALIALWTILSGPVFSGPKPWLPSSHVPASTASSSMNRGKLQKPVSLQQLAIEQTEAAKR